MTEIDYKYRNIQEIIQSIDVYMNFSLLQIILLLLVSVLVMIAILYGIPMYKKMLSLKTLESEKKRKKLALKQIVIQKEVESEIEKELQEEEKEKQGK